MPQVNKTPLASLTLLLLFVFLLAGCGDENKPADFNANAGTHPSGWIPTDHMTAAKANVQTCADCHGADYRGGISKIACTKCHLGNQNSVHPTAWGIQTYAFHGDYVKLNGTTACANALCHGANLDGVGGTGPSCTQCHLGGISSFHPVAWSNNNIRLHKDYVGANGDSSCRNASCHGANLQGVNLSGPACSLCHN
jgi:hypothetical protein